MLSSFFILVDMSPFLFLIRKKKKHRDLVFGVFTFLFFNLKRMNYIFFKRGRISYRTIYLFLLLSELYCSLFALSHLPLVIVKRHTTH